MKEINGKMLYEELKEKYEELQIKYIDKEAENEKQKIELENMKLELSNLKRIVFGTKREHTPNFDKLEDTSQCSLFNETVNTIDEDLGKQIEEAVETITIHRKKKAKKRVAGIKNAALKNVQIEAIEYKLDESVGCPECGGTLNPIAKKVVRQEIKSIPAKLQIVSYVQYIYKCNGCGSKNSRHEDPTFVKSEIPKALLAHSFVSPSLATEVIYQKYYMGVPLYRQEKVWDDRGLVLPRNMMANWCIKLSEYYLEGLCNLMLDKMKTENQVMHGDETRIQCNKEEGRDPSRESFMWLACSGVLEEHRGVYFKYNQSRSGKVAEEFWKGYQGILETDGYAGYNNISDVTHAECWAHARRYFLDSMPTEERKKNPTVVPSSLGFKGVNYCNQLFDIERQIAELTPDEKKKVRQDKSKPILDAFFAWVNETLENKVVINKKLKEALVYASNQQKELSEFLNDGRIPLDNSLAERTIRPFAVHRKNWLFADTPEGAKANAVYYSLVESAKINNLNIHRYIEYLLEQIPQLENPNDRELLEKYLPWSKDFPDDILNFQSTENENAELLVVSEE